MNNLSSDIVDIIVKFTEQPYIPRTLIQQIKEHFALNYILNLETMRGFRFSYEYNTRNVFSAEHKQIALKRLVQIELIRKLLLPYREIDIYSSTLSRINLDMGNSNTKKILNNLTKNGLSDFDEKSKKIHSLSKSGEMPGVEYCKDVTIGGLKFILFIETDYEQEISTYSTEFW
jgi:hypothetical protein